MKKIASYYEDCSNLYMDKTEFFFKGEIEGSKRIVRMLNGSAALVAAVVGVVAFSVIALLSVIPFSVLKIGGSASQIKDCRGFIKTNSKNILFLTLVTIGSAVNICTLTFFREKVRENIGLCSSYIM